MCHIGFHTRPQFMDKTAAKGYLLPLRSEVRLNSDLITRLLPRAKWNAESIHQAKCSTKREYHEKNSEAFQWGWSFAILLGAREMQLGGVIFSKRLSTFSTCLLMFQSSDACVLANHNVKHFCDSQKNTVHAIHCNSFNNIKSRNKHKPRISFDSTDRCIVSLKFCSVLDTHNQECSSGYSLLHNLLTGFLC